MNLVSTIVPISIEDLKKYFTDKSVYYIINYKDSKLKGAKLLTYLSNLDISCDIDLSNLTLQETYELLDEYLKTSMIVNIPSLEFLAMDVLKECKGLTAEVTHRDFILEHKDLLQTWITKLDSLTLFNMSVISDNHFEEFTKQFPTSEDQDLIGVNFVSLLKHQEFYDFYKKVDTTNLKFYTRYFKDYMFKGKSLYSFWANENNPLFLLTYGIAEGLVDPQQYNEAKRQTIEESNVTPI